jgi:hypothetical protein
LAELASLRPDSHAANQNLKLLFAVRNLKFVFALTARVSFKAQEESS